MRSPSNPPRLRALCHLGSTLVCSAALAACGSTPLPTAQPASGMSAFDAPRIPGAVDASPIDLDADKIKRERTRQTERAGDATP